MPATLTDPSLSRIYLSRRREARRWRLVQDKHRLESGVASLLAAAFGLEEVTDAGQAAKREKTREDAEDEFRERSFRRGAKHAKNRLARLGLAGKVGIDG